MNSQDIQVLRKIGAIELATLNGLKDENGQSLYPIAREAVYKGVLKLCRLHIDEENNLAYYPEV